MRESVPGSGLLEVEAVAVLFEQSIGQFAIN
jgi:hypothetical protein